MGLVTVTHHLGAFALGPTRFLPTNYGMRITDYIHRLSGCPGSSEKSLLYATTAILLQEQQRKQQQHECCIMTFFKELQKLQKRGISLSFRSASHQRQLSQLKSSAQQYCSLEPLFGQCLPKKHTFVIKRKKKPQQTGNTVHPKAEMSANQKMKKR